MASLRQDRSAVQLRVGGRTPTALRGAGWGYREDQRARSRVCVYPRLVAAARTVLRNTATTNRAHDRLVPAWYLLGTAWYRLVRAWSKRHVVFDSDKCVMSCCAGLVIALPIGGTSNCSILRMAGRLCRAGSDCLACVFVPCRRACACVNDARVRACVNARVASSARGCACVCETALPAVHPQPRVP